jgi:hypothetical protein
MKDEKRPKPSKVTEARRTSAVLALIAEPTIEAAAQAAGIARSTLCLWLRDETFTAELTRARGAAFDGGLNTIKGGCEEAARVLLALLKSRNETTRRRAAEIVLAFALRAHENLEVEARLSKVELIIRENEKIKY